MGNIKTIVLVLKSGGDFAFRDVELIVRHIIGLWKEGKPNIILLWDKASQEYNLGNLHIIPLKGDAPGTWSRVQLYSPEMEKYRPFLYIDLDTAIFQSLENIFDLIKDHRGEVITLEDFWQKGELATGLMWFPASSVTIKEVWGKFKGKEGFRMDVMLRRFISNKLFFQQITNTIVDAKPKLGFIQSLPENAGIVCFHGHPRIFEAKEQWVKDYINKEYHPKVTVIIPYKVDRGWLKDAIESVPKWVQLIVSQGEGNWPANFNKALPQATGDYIKFLHEDDMLTPGSIEDALKCFEETGADFIHGNATELTQATGEKKIYVSSIPTPTIHDLKLRNTIHCPTLMYKREIFDALGGFDETLNTQEEFEFNLRCLKAGFKIGYCNHILAIYRRHDKQKVRTVPTSEKKAEKQKVLAQYEK